MPKAKEKKSA